MVSRNAVVSHCAEMAEIRRSVMRCGRATLMIVSLRITVNAEMMSTQMTVLLRWRVAALGASTGCSAVATGVRLASGDSVMGTPSSCALVGRQRGHCDGDWRIGCV